MDKQSNSTTVPKNSIPTDGKGKSSKVRAPYPLDLLPFTALRNGKELPKYDTTKNELPRCFWNVEPTGDYAADCRVGNKFALDYLLYEEADGGGSGCLNLIVQDMPREFSGIEYGFLHMVCFAARAGAYRAREISAYWAEREQEAANA